MPRRPRIHLAGFPLHLVQRGHKRDACFFGVEDFQAYRHWLGEVLKSEPGPFSHAVFASSTGSPSAAAAWLSRTSKDEKAIRTPGEICRKSKAAAR